MLFVHVLNPIEDITKGKLYFNQSIVPTLEPMGQYQASKVASYTATLDHVEHKKPNNSVVTLHPVFVFGHNILQKTADELGGTNGMLFGSLYSEEPMFADFHGVNILDVANAHVKALSLPDAPLESFPLSASDRTWEDVTLYANKEFPEGGFKTKPKIGDRWNVDTTRAGAQLGFGKWREMEEQVKDTVLQQLQLRSDAAST